MGALTWARIAAVALAVMAATAAAAGLSGCGSKHAAGTTARIHGKMLTIYVSAPLRGVSSVSGAAAIEGAKLALAQRRGRDGQYRIVLKPLDDATLQRGGWDPNQTTANAKVAVLDPTTIGYLGDFNSGAAAISIPPLNRQSIAQVAPAASAVGLTSARSRSRCSTASASRSSAPPTRPSG